jgi:hypothetical protein
LRATEGKGAFYRTTTPHSGNAGNNCDTRVQAIFGRRSPYRNLAERPMFNGKLPGYHPTVL